MSRPHTPLAIRRALAISAIAPILLAAGLATRAGATPSNTATADAYGSSQTQTGPSIVNASASLLGPGGGSAAAGASAGSGSLSIWCSESGCSILFPPDGQVCNGGTGQSSLDDQVTIVSDAPDGTPVDVLATFEVDGGLEGEGAYFYQSACLVFTTGLAGANGSSGGVVVAAPGTPISSFASNTIALNTGYTYGIDASASASVTNRCCDSGYESRGMSLSLGARLTLSVPTLPPGATFVHVIGSVGHDYSPGTAAVEYTVLNREGLSPARPNPTRGSSRIDLTLSRPRSVDVGVFDLAGRRVATLTRGMLEAGTHSLVWDGRDDRGAGAIAGMYFVHARGEGLETSCRVMRVP